MVANLNTHLLRPDRHPWLAPLPAACPNKAPSAIENHQDVHNKTGLAYTLCNPYPWCHLVQVKPAFGDDETSCAASFLWWQQTLSAQETLWDAVGSCSANIKQESDNYGGLAFWSRLLASKTLPEMATATSPPYSPPYTVYTHHSPRHSPPPSPPPPNPSFPNPTPQKEIPTKMHVIPTSPVPRLSSRPKTTETCLAVACRSEVGNSREGRGRGKGETIQRVHARRPVPPPQPLSFYMSAKSPQPANTKPCSPRPATSKLTGPLSLFCQVPPGDHAGKP